MWIHFLIACSVPEADIADTTAAEEADADTDSDTDADPAYPLPDEGRWAVTDYDLSEDDCGLASWQSVDDFVPSTFDIAHTGESSFTMAADGGEAGACSIDMDGDFSCDSDTVSEEVGFGLDATMIIETAFSGELTQSTEMTGQTDLEVTCEGSSCEWLTYAGLDFPCPMVIDIDIAAE